jgi:CheY-like chemotaxis protein
MRDGKYVVLCVDDDPVFLDVMREVLEANGYIMAEAESAEQGLRVYEESQPDLVIADLMMEEVDAGAIFVRELKARASQVPIYMASTVGDSLSTTIDAAELGLEGVLQKPIDSQTLLSLLEAKLE